MTTRMSPDDPRHGTVDQPISVAFKGCLCTGCERSRAHSRRMHKQRALGSSQYADAAPVREHLERLKVNGWKASEISRASGIAEGTLCDISQGRAKQVRTSTVKALVGLPSRPPRGEIEVQWSLSALGTIRRLQALSAIGYTMREVCTEAGLSPGYGRNIMSDLERSGRTGRITLERALAIKEVFDRLHMTPAPPNRISNAARGRARARGWAPPLAWDNIDDPNDFPKGVGGGIKISVDHEHREKVIRAAVEAGQTLLEVEAELGITRTPLRQWCRKYGLQEEYRQLGRNSNRDGRKGSGYLRLRETRIEKLTRIAEENGTVDDAIRELGVTREALWKWCKQNDLAGLYDRICDRTRQTENRYTAKRRAAA